MLDNLRTVAVVVDYCTSHSCLFTIAIAVADCLCLLIRGCNVSPPVTRFPAVYIASDV